MHFLMLVTLSMPTVASSADVRQAVFERLLNDGSFCGDGGRFGSPLCDWFLIGGRWSGLLAETVIGDAFKKAVLERFPAMPGQFDPHSLATHHEEEFDALWASCGGIVPNPYSRPSGDEHGHPDDAMILTRQLYDPLLSGFEGKETVNDGSYCEFADLDGEPLSPGFIGRKWLVVVDYHN